jgi:hypothetical protein
MSKRPSKSTAQNPPNPRSPIASVPTPQTDWWVAGPTLAAVVISLVLGVYNIRATSDQLSLAAAQNKITSDQGTQAKGAEEVEERPWLSVESCKLALDDFPGPGFECAVANTGKTPALEVRIRFSAAKSPALGNKILITRKEVLANSVDGVVAPNNRISLRDLSFSGLGLPKAFGQKFADNTRSFGRVPVILNGAISYTDAYGTEGYTAFCFLLRNGNPAGQCIGTPSDMR